MVLVTGASGLLGNNVLRVLLARGYKVRVLLRSQTPMLSLQDLAIEIVRGDLVDADSVDAAVKGCEYVIHAGANTDVWPVYQTQQFRVNVDGTAHIMNACLRHGVKRLIHVSSANVFGFGSLDAPGIENTPFKSRQYQLGYLDSKYEAQTLVEKYVKEKGLPAVIVNPSFMLGAYDTKPSSGAMILAIHSQKAPGYPAGGKNYIHVQDAAQATVNALEMGAIGESYILANENLSYKEAFQRIAAVLKVKAPTLALPPFATKLYGRWGSWSGRAFGKKPAVSYPLARIACDAHYFDASKARRVLKLPQTPLETAVEEAFAWFEAHDYL